MLEINYPKIFVHTPSSIKKNWAPTGKNPRPSHPQSMPRAGPNVWSSYNIKSKI